MNENIQQLFSLLDSNQQKVLVKVLAEHYDKKPLSIRNNWFSGYKHIPNQYQDEVLRILQRRIELFNLTPQS
tara:strand:+ start:2493 stop:2708 length:216 start_codon:yes stop_codon:yes gene_type:complete